jgi:hypothetical protein
MDNVFKNLAMPLFVAQILLLLLALFLLAGAYQNRQLHHALFWRAVAGLFLLASLVVLILFAFH